MSNVERPTARVASSDSRTTWPTGAFGRQTHGERELHPIVDSVHRHFGPFDNDAGIGDW